MKKAKTVTDNHHKSTSSNNGEEEEDWISKLPDSLLHLILSFLDMSVVVQTSFLSRRWRYLWTSLPFLNLDCHSYIQVHNSRIRNSLLRFGQNKENHSGFDWFIFVDRVLSLRNQNFNIERFSVGRNLFGPHYLTIAPQCPSIARIESWILTVVRQNVKEIDLTLRFGNYLPRIFKCVSHCKSLITLKLALSSQKPTNFQLPHDVDDDDDDSMKINLPSLKTLHLNSVEFLRGKMYDNFFSRSCPVLETLVISTSITSELTISAHQLKNLVIFDMNGVDVMVYGSSTYPMLSVFAPKLITFCYKGGSLFKGCSLKNNSSLLKAEITTTFSGSYHNVGTMMNRKLKVWVDEKRKVKHTENLIKCLRQISNVRCLTLSTWLLEGVYEIYKTGFRGLLTPFCNLSVLKLTTTLSMSHNRVIAYLLEECPNVEDVVFELPKSFPNSLKEEEEEIDLPSHCNLHYLKFVQIQNSTGTSNELAFLKFLLKNAMILEKVTAVCTFNCLEVSNRERFKTFREKLVNFVAASNSCTKIYFKYLS